MQKSIHQSLLKGQRLSLEMPHNRLVVNPPVDEHKEGCIKDVQLNSRTTYRRHQTVHMLRQVIVRHLKDDDTQTV